MMLGGVEYVIPPLTIGALKRLGDRLKNLKADLSDETISTVTESVYCALKRNYPELKIEEVEEFVDVGNMQGVIAAVMDVSGLLRKKQEAEEDEGKTVGQSLGTS